VELLTVGAPRTGRVAQALCAVRGHDQDPLPGGELRGIEDAGRRVRRALHEHPGRATAAAAPPLPWRGGLGGDDLGSTSVDGAGPARRSRMLAALAFTPSTSAISRGSSPSQATTGAVLRRRAGAWPGPS